MSLRLYDTLSRSVRDFVPRRPGVATIYLCGPTVQSPPHIGHVRGMINFDVLRRWLERGGQRVVFCRNVTDIEDKVIAKSAAEGVPFWEVAYRNERAFGWAYETLGCLPPTIEPRATGHTPEILELVQRLIDGGHAYAAGGDVYFDVASWPAYGELSGQRPENVQPADDTDPTTAGQKRDPRDFALWKAAKEGEPAWPSPYGPGRPGWHIECSAMAEHYLGGGFDIHGGGMDLLFPHHENELAQSTAADYEFAAYWMHNGLVTTAGEKMSKSMGNSMLVTEVVRRVRPVELRYYLAAPHYRSVIEASLESIDEAAAAYRRLESFVVRATEVVGPVSLDAALPEPFVAAMDDNLGVPGALAAVHDAVREGNRALDSGDKAAAESALGVVRAMLDVLGLDPYDPRWRGGESADLSGVVNALVAVALEQRQAARARKDYGAADTIRDELAAAGVAVEDTRDGARWTLQPPERVVAGNSQRKGARRQTDKKGSLVGSGGQRRKGLQGRGPTPPAEERTGHPAARRAGAAGRRRSDAGSSAARPDGDAPELLVGRNPVVEALRARVPATALYLALGIEVDERVAEVVRRAGDRGVALLEVSRAELDRLTGGLLHQGVALAVPPFAYAHPDDLLAAAVGPALVVALDAVTDPRNLGAIVRSAAAFGAAGVVIPRRRAAGMTAVAWRTSAGTAARLPIARATNLVRTLGAYQDAGLTVVGLDTDGDTAIDDLTVATDPVCLVVGSEGRGLSRLVGESCDVKVSIPMSSAAESLNASVAAAVVLAEIARRRRAQ